MCGDIEVQRMGVFASEQSVEAVNAAQGYAHQDPCDFDDYQYCVKIVQECWTASFPAGHD
jgi:stage V sporulation protein SpoVS